MVKGITPKTVMNMVSKNRINENMNINDLNLGFEDFSMDDLILNDDESNYDSYIQLKVLLNSVCVCQVSDAYNAIARKSGVIKGLKSVNNHRAYGKIVTCKTNSDDWGTGLFAIDEAKKGDILFLYATGEPSAIWGELASTCALEKGIVGVAVYGCMRDIDVVLHMNFPLFASKLVPNAGSPLGLGEVNINLDINNEVIKPGDFFFGDESGVIIIPKEMFNKVIIETLHIKLKESKIINQLKSGMSLSEVVGLK